MVFCFPSVCHREFDLGGYLMGLWKIDNALFSPRPIKEQACNSLNWLSGWVFASCLQVWYVKIVRNSVLSCVAIC